MSQKFFCQNGDVSVEIPSFRVLVALRLLTNHKVHHSLVYRHELFLEGLHLGNFGSRLSKNLW